MSPKRFRDSKLVQHEGRMMLEGSISVSTRRPWLSVWCRSLFLALALRCICGLTIVYSYISSSTARLKNGVWCVSDWSSRLIRHDIMHLHITRLIHVRWQDPSARCHSLADRSLTCRRLKSWSSSSSAECTHKEWLIYASAVAITFTQCK